MSTTTELPPDRVFAVGRASVDTDPGVAHLDELIVEVNGLDGDASAAGLIDRLSRLEHLKSSVAAAQARLVQAFAVQSTTEARRRTHDEEAWKLRAEGVRVGVARQVGLALQESPHSGAWTLHNAEILTADLPHTLAALANGETSERRVAAVVRQFNCLTSADRRVADLMIAPDLHRLGDQKTENAARQIAARLDPAAVLAKTRGAVKDRRVSVRPAPDTMTWLSALLPVAQGVAVYAQLRKAAAGKVSGPGGDARSVGQIMADELVSRVTGQEIVGCDDYGVPIYGTPAAAAADERSAPESSADGARTKRASTDDAPTDMPPAGEAPTGPVPADSAATGGAGAGTASAESAAAGGAAAESASAAGAAAESAAADPDSADSEAEDADPDTGRAGAENTCACRGKAGNTNGVQLRIVMTARALFGDDDEPAHLQGYGAIPAPLARAILAGQASEQTKIWVKRLFTDPTGTQLLAADSRSRLFPAGVKDFLLARDQVCRTPWCDAPIRHFDHVVAHADGGPTDLRNGQGLCEACNLAKELADWTGSVGIDGAVTTTTPTGHVYESYPPRPPRSEPWDRRRRLPPGYVDVVTMYEQGWRRVA